MLKALLAIALLGIAAQISVLGAPAPLPREPRTPTHFLRPSDLVGEWVLIWGEARLPASLGADYSFRCRLPSQTWVGCWSLAGVRLLGITEGPMVNPPAWPDPLQMIEWSVLLEPDSSGRWNRADLHGTARLRGAAIRFRMIKPTALKPPP